MAAIRVTCVCSNIRGRAPLSEVNAHALRGDKLSWEHSVLTCPCRICDVRPTALALRPALPSFWRNLTAGLTVYVATGSARTLDIAHVRYISLRCVLCYVHYDTPSVGDEGARAAAPQLTSQLRKGKSCTHTQQRRCVHLKGVRSIWLLSRAHLSRR